jgi:acetylornithine deacetylase/succinyl-diaminopimelate desuccinylase-like protein
VRQLAEHRPVARLDELWPALVATIDAPADLKAALLDASTADDAIDSLPVPVARRCHATTHTTFSPNVIAGGTKVNVIPDEVLIDVDIRTLPGVTADEVDAQIRDALGDLGAKVELVALSDDPASRSAHDNRLWDVLRRRVQAVYPDVEPLPTLAVGATDARYFRRRGAVGFGAGLFSEAIDPNEFGSRFHGHDERVDVESLRLTTDLWLGVARELLT